MAIPNWGPMAGQEVANPDEYARQNPPPPGGNFTAASVGPGSVLSGGALSPLPANPSQDYWSNYFSSNAAGPGLSMPGFNAANQDQARAQQNQVIQDLQGQAAGSLDTGAQRQLRQGYQQAGAQQSSIGSSIRGQSAGAAMRGIQSGQAGIQRGFGGDQQMLKLQEQQAAQAMLAQLLAQQHGQDIGQAQSMAQGQLHGDALNEAMRQFYAQQGLRHDVESSQIRDELNRAAMGIDLNASDRTSRLIQQGAQAAATAGATYAAQNRGGSSSSTPPSESQTKIDAAFNGG